MPTVLHMNGLRVRIYSNDHRPAHVHVIGAEGEAVFILNCPDGPPSLRGAYGLNRKAVSQIGRDLVPHLKALCQNWSDIHGSD